MAYGACDDPKAGSAKRISYLIGPDGRVRKAYGKLNAPEHPGRGAEGLVIPAVTPVLPPAGV
jgi:peroxiredoxin